MDTHDAAPELEVAHVLFMDIVAYSKLPMDHQREFIGKLQKATSNSSEFVRAKNQGQLISLPTGDGMALVFFGNAEAPVKCAIELTRSLRSVPELKLRMGLHTGPVYRMADINANRNVSGGGINIAQRVTDCGDAGHILVSETLASLLSQVSGWPSSLRDLGETEVKHGVRVHVFNFVRDDVGNHEIPRAFCHATKASGKTEASSGVKPHNQYRIGFGIGAIAVLAIIIATGFAIKRIQRRNSSSPFSDFKITKLTDSGNLMNVAISPDGKYVLNIAEDKGKQSLWLRNIATNSITQVSVPTDSRIRGVQFSQGGDFIYYGRGENEISYSLYRQPILGGSGGNCPRFS